MRIWTRVLVGGVTAALVAGAAGVAVASSTSTAGHAAASSAKASPGAEKNKVGKGRPGGSLFDVPKTAAFLAAQLGISADQAKVLVTQLEQLAGKAGSINPSDPAFIAMARQAHVTPQQLSSALVQLKMSAEGASDSKASPGTEKNKDGKGGPGGSLFDEPKAAPFLAAQLGIGADQAKVLVTQLQQLAGKSGSIDPSDPAFIAIARQAQVTPQQLVSALSQLKMSMHK